MRKREEYTQADMEAYFIRETGMSELEIGWARINMAEQCLRPHYQEKTVKLFTYDARFWAWYRTVWHIADLQLHAYLQGRKAMRLEADFYINWHLQKSSKMKWHPPRALYDAIISHSKSVQDGQDKPCQGGRPGSAVERAETAREGTKGDEGARRKRAKKVLR